MLHVLHVGLLPGLPRGLLDGGLAPDLREGGLGRVLQRQRVGEGEDQTVVSEPLALVPLVSELAGPGAANSVLGAPPPQKAGNRGEGQAIWLVASRDIEAGERLVAADPW